MLIGKLPIFFYALIISLFLAVMLIYVYSPPSGKNYPQNASGKNFSFVFNIEHMVGLLERNLGLLIE